jgi:Flp pilus assembly protein TadD
MDGTLPETRRLRYNVEWALRRALDPSTVLPMLHRLSRLAADGSDENLYAQRHLAELLADHHPWRAALCARRVVAAQPRDDGAWAILALCHALLGNPRCAVAAYRRALSLAPENPAYAHNLGHLLDVALGASKEALPFLRAAYELGGRRADVAASFAHALARAGELAEAKRVSRRALRAADGAGRAEHRALSDWLAAGAPADARILPHRPPAQLATARAPFVRAGARRSRGARRPSPETRGAGREATASDLPATLARGLGSLPLDRAQRARARGIAESPSVQSMLHGGQASLASVAAAVAYAVVYVDHVPLTQAEVAACFRVSVPALRVVWKAIRALLDLTPGDARVATTRPG